MSDRRSNVSMQGRSSPSSASPSSCLNGPKVIFPVPEGVTHSDTYVANEAATLEHDCTRCPELTIDSRGGLCGAAIRSVHILAHSGSWSPRMARRTYSAQSPRQFQ